MTYYEEFGVRQDASVEEIRQAYRLLIRILHPDIQEDSRLKSLAECQMKRLGELAAILANPEQRRKYDDSLSSAHWMLIHSPVPVEIGIAQIWKGAQRFTSHHWFGILIGMTVVALVLWNGTSRYTNDALSEAAPRGEAALEAHASRPVLVPREPVKNALPPNPPLGRRGRAYGVETPFPLPKQERAEVPVAAANEMAPANRIAASPKTNILLAPAPQPFAGRWLYSSEGVDATEPGQYAARYVEFVLVEEGGRLVGDYRALYKITDQAMSSEVAFRVFGWVPAVGASATLSWTSPAGGTGMAKLKLQAPGVMHLTWWTTQFGRQAVLASGTAVLIRQQVQP